MRKKSPPRAAPQPWHAESVRAWNEHYDRCQVGKAERKKIRERYAERVHVESPSKKKKEPKE